MLAVTWQDSRFPAGAYDSIAFSRSTRRRPHVVAPRCASTATLPCARSSRASRSADDGTIGVAYYDFRSNTRGPGDAPHRLLARHVDRRRQLDRAAHRRTRSTTRRRRSAGGRYFLGDYMGIDGRGQLVRAAVRRARPRTRAIARTSSRASRGRSPATPSAARAVTVGVDPRRRADGGSRGAHRRRDPRRSARAPRRRWMRARPA